LAINNWVAVIIEILFYTKIRFFIEKYGVMRHPEHFRD
jgi:hypothetical protein